MSNLSRFLNGAMKKETVDKSKTLIGCFLVHFFLAGAGGVSSIYFVETLNQYNVNRKQASFPYVLESLMYPLAGPLAGYLEHIFGIKVVITTGCIVAAISIGACYFAESILAITILWGVSFGYAHGFACLLLPSLINKHFPNDMSKSNGFLFAGVGFSGIFMAPILHTCLRFYGYSGSFLIISAIVAHSIPASLLCKIPKNTIKNKIRNSKNQVREDIVETNKDECDCKLHASGESGNTYTHIVATTKDECDCKLHASGESGNTYTHIAATTKDGNDCKSHISGKTGNTQDKPMLLSVVNVSNFCNCAYKQDSNVPYSNCSKLDSNKSSNAVCIKDIFQKHLLPFRKFNVFLDPAFLLMLIITAGAGFMIITMKTTIVDVVRDKEIKEDLFVYYVMIYYASELAGHFISGFIIDRHYCSYPVMTSISFIGCGLFTTAFIYFKNYIVVMICVVFISIFLASLILLPISLFHEYMENDTRTMAMSCRYILHSPVSLAVPYAIGYFRGTKGSYNGLLYIFVGISIFCACVVHFIPYLVKLRRTIKRSDCSTNSGQKEKLQN